MRKTILTTAPLVALLLLSCAQKPSTQKPDITYMPQPPFNPPDVCLLQGPRSYQDRRKAFSRGMGRDTLDQRLRRYRRRQTPGPSLPDPGQDDLR